MRNAVSSSPPLFPQEAYMKLVRVILSRRGRGERVGHHCGLFFPPPFPSFFCEWRTRKEKVAPEITVEGTLPPIFPHLRRD